MKTTKLYLVVCLTFILTQFNAFAQYRGGTADGAASEVLGITSCPVPPHFYAYFGGTNDGSGVEELTATSCGTAAFQFAYMGGSSDGAGTEEFSINACATPPSFYAYFGGTNDGAGVETTEASACAYPPQFYAYFGGLGDGFSLDKTAPICPTQPPVASFTASTTALCVGQSVTFTDTSTNIPFVWSWTITGATPGTSTSQNPTFTFNTAGLYTVVFTATNYNGSNTVTFTDYISVTAVPVVNSTTPAARCDAGTVTLQATATLGTLNWYDAPTGGNLVGSGTSFTTPSITATTSYYVESAIGSCVSARVQVIATVNTTPTITSTTPGNRCGSGVVTISATASAGTIRWYDLATGGTLLSNGASFSPNIALTTTYYVETTTGTCTSSRTPVIATINTVPSVASTAPAGRCDSGTVTLGATASAGTLNWYSLPTGGTLLGSGTSFTTPVISSTTIYYVEAADGTCNSGRTPVTATISVTPSITSTTPSQVCDSGTVILTASSNAGVLNWYDQSSGGIILGTGTNFTTPSISTTTTFYVEAVNGSCVSVRVPVIATVNTSPTITSTTDASQCGTAGSTLSANASAGTVYWYFTPSGGAPFATGNSIPVSGSSITVYAEAIHNGCSSVRVPVVYTSNPIPMILTAIPAARCDAGTVTLNATSDIGTINWYDAPTGGNLVGTGTSFTTPAISTTTSYYIAAASSSCTSARVEVIATVNETPIIISTTPNERCGAGVVTISATASTGTIRWYDQPSGGTLLNSGGSFSPNIALTTTYYVEAVSGNCTSSRTAVVAAINSAPSVTSTVPAGRCDSGTITLGATASAGTLNWYDSPSGGTLLGSGTSFTTPIISSTTVYYVEAVDGTCNSVRTAVSATISVTPSITSTTPSQVCDSGTALLTASSNAEILNWYDQPSGGSVLGTGTNFTTPSISTTTTFYVEAVNGSCISVRVPVIVTVNSSPTITSTVDAEVCGNVGASLSATTSAGIVYWYFSPSGGAPFASGNSIPVSGSSMTVYAEAIHDGCSSVRVPVVYTNNPIPMILTLAPASRCGAGTVTLGATTDVGTINWYDAPTAGNLVGTGNSFTTPNISTTTTYYVESSSASCTTQVRSAVTATINEQPLITSTTPASRCGDGIVQLFASASAGTLYWYDAPTGGNLVTTGTSYVTPVLGTSTTYYVEVVDGSCSSARTAVVATVYEVSFITSVTPDSRCDSGTLTLQAASSNGLLSWYDAPTGGNLVGTGTSFTTPLLTATTTYYVETQNGDCISARTAVTATIAPTAAPGGVINQTYCNGETVGLIVVSGSNIIWYDAPTAGNIIPAGTPIVSGTTYYASQTLNGCESEIRLGVTMTEGGCLGNEEFTTNVIKLYPNPVIDLLYISSSETMSKVEVVNMLGQVIIVKTINELETQVDLSRYSTGTYIVRVLVDDKVEIFKVIKK